MAKNKTKKASSKMSDAKKKKLILALIIGISVITIGGSLLYWFVLAYHIPEGEILFISKRDFKDMGEEEGVERSTTSIYKMKAGGSEPERLTDEMSAFDNPTWSPDGKKIAYVGEQDIFTMSSDGYSKRKLIIDGFFPQWSPDSKKIIFIKEAPNYDNNLFVVNSDGGRITHLVKEHVTQMEWSPDGKKIVFTKGRTGPNEQAVIFTIKSDGSDETALPSGESGDANSPSWSPDGKKIAFSSNDGKGMDIYTVDSNGKNLKKLDLPKSLGKWRYMPKWSPDGKSIAFLVSTNAPWYKQQAPIDLVVVDVKKTKKPVKLTNLDKGEFIVDVEWADGKNMLVSIAKTDLHSEEKETISNIYWGNTKGQLKKITDTDSDISPSWKPAK